MSKNYKTWGDIYNALLDRGFDHGYAAYRADEWQKRQQKNFDEVNMEFVNDEKTLTIAVNRNTVDLEFQGAEVEAAQVYQDVKALFDEHPEEEVIDALQQFYARRSKTDPDLYASVANIMAKIFHLVA